MFQRFAYLGVVIAIVLVLDVGPVQADDLCGPGMEMRNTSLMYGGVNMRMCLPVRLAIIPIQPPPPCHAEALDHAVSIAAARDSATKNAISLFVMDASTNDLRQTLANALSGNTDAQTAITRCDDASFRHAIYAFSTSQPASLLDVAPQSIFAPTKDPFERWHTWIYTPPPTVYTQPEQPTEGQHIDFAPAAVVPEQRGQSDCIVYAQPTDWQPLTDMPGGGAKLEWRQKYAKAFGDCVNSVSLRLTNMMGDKSVSVELRHCYVSGHGSGTFGVHAAAGGQQTGTLALLYGIPHADIQSCDVSWTVN